MPVRRKVFRIEACLDRAVNDCTGAADAAVGDKADTVVRRAIAATRQEIAALHGCGLSAPAGRGVRRELDAVAIAAEQAVQQILTAAEEIDRAANSLATILQREQDQALAQGIRAQMLRIFEACNFHDLAGQRISKVQATLKSVDDRVARVMAIWSGIDALREPAPAAQAADSGGSRLLNGPKLEGDPGHASQEEIDAMFAAT